MSISLGSVKSSIAMALILLLAVSGVLAGFRILQHLSPSLRQPLLATLLLVVCDGVPLLGNPRLPSPMMEATAP